MLLHSTALIWGCGAEVAWTAAPPDTAGTFRGNTANTAPNALFTVSPRWPRPGDTVTVDASYSLDRDGSVVAFEWDFGNGASQVSGPQARAVFSQAGSYSVQVTVVDDSGGRSTRSLSLAVSAAGAPPTAVDSVQSLVAIANTSPLASAATTVTVTTRNVHGLPVPNVPVWLSGRGREWQVTQPSALTTALGVAIGAVSSPMKQSAQVVAIADYTLLRMVSVNIGAASVSASRSSVRLTDPVVGAAGDSTLLEVTARDAGGNPIVGAAVSLSVTGGTSTVRNEGPTDANGRRVVVIEPTSCGGASLTVAATVNGTAIGTTSTVTTAAPAVYGLCGAALWLDGDDASTLTQSGGTLSAWQDKSGGARHATASSGPTVNASAFNGRTALRFNGTTQFVPIADVASQTPYTLFVVERRRSGRSLNFAVGGSNGTALNGLVLGYATETLLRLATNADPLDGAVPVFAGIGAEPGRLLVGRWSSGARSLMSNGALVTSDASTSTLAEWTGAAIGRANQSGSLSYFDGDIGELLIYRRALSDAERTTVSQALMRKWSLGTLTTTAGNNQTAAVGATVTTQPQVRVLNEAGDGIAGATIAWQVTAGGGSTSTSVSTTDANGYASVSWTLGSSGSNSLVAWYGASVGTGQSATFTATASNCVYGVCSPVVWLDAQDESTVTLTGSRVSQWRDKSASALIARPITGDVGPTYPTSGGALLNGRRALAFDAAVAAASLKISPSLAAGITVYVVGQSVATAWNSHGWLANARGANGFILHPDLNSRQLTGYIVNTSGAYSALAGVTPSSITIPHLYGLSYAAPSALTLLDGAATSSTVSVSRNSGVVDVYLGRDFCCIGRNGTGSIGEVLIYNRALTTAERQLVERAIMARWGIGTFVISAGNNQSVTTGSRPSVAPTARLTDATGAAIAGSPVTWQVTGGGARFGSSTTFSTVTDGSGFATVPLTGGQALTIGSGSNQITAWLAGEAGRGRSVVFTLTGLP